ncbi:MAG: hypothetical protein DI551_04980 [Micavibrio aeruginosavorus]|uniref:Uncharacterized protein n=1 Tax=Micavibrio aeruginosavorus TaxID=349221 RepID=A0A2W5PVR9_9BACT|nr:MAG: hypothetical protein DI551_04980 [Micavibrio aeruginosavorus]
MNWQRLDRDTTLKVIDSVKSVDEAGLFSPGTSEVQRARLSFYDSIELFKLTNFASLPSFTFQYLGSGNLFTLLDGTEHPIYATNDKGHLSLNDRSVVDYLEFFFSHVLEEDEEMALIKNPHDMPLLDSLGGDSLEAVIRNHKPAEVSYDAGFDKYTVEADLYADGLLIRAAIEVTAAGRVSLIDRKMIVNAVALSGISRIMA